MNEVYVASCKEGPVLMQFRPERQHNHHLALDEETEAERRGDSLGHTVAQARHDSNPTAWFLPTALSYVTNML